MASSDWPEGLRELQKVINATNMALESFSEPIQEKQLIYLKNQLLRQLQAFKMEADSLWNKRYLEWLNAKVR